MPVVTEKRVHFYDTDQMEPALKAGEQRSVSRYGYATILPHRDESPTAKKFFVN